MAPREADSKTPLRQRRDQEWSQLPAVAVMAYCRLIFNVMAARRGGKEPPALSVVRILEVPYCPRVVPHKSREAHGAVRIELKR